MFLFEQIDQARVYGAYKDFPKYIAAGLNNKFEMREYQKAAFQHFITYFENEKLCKKPTQTLFHMATGSGKTLIMAGLMLYLYKQGYRNFLFFVNLDNIVKKTKENFLTATSSKYLFAEEINIDGESIKIKEVTNFQYSGPDSINICFTTTQGLHSDMWAVKQGAISFDDFASQKVVLISDEAHHLNADTRKGNVGSDNDANKSWEYTVNQIFGINKDNVLLEFTATCDLQNPYIREVYEDKIIYDYPLKKFREDGFSKEVKTLQSDIPIIDRAIQATMLSQYRLKIFQDNRLAQKPVILFKSAKIRDSEEFIKLFNHTIDSLTGGVLERIAANTNHPTLQTMYSYFATKGVSFELLAQEIKEEFGADHCISVNDDKEAEQNQIVVNSLEDIDNPYRAIFEVKKLDEGWDVLNLFDIVRLYETRDAKNNKPGKSTVAEAQLIGRGARYCPFILSEEQNKYQRKYDSDLDNPLRVCEELYYHCQYDSRYISELTTALKETGIMPDEAVEINYKLKDEFKEDEIYKSGLVFINRRVLKSRKNVFALLPSVRDKEYIVTAFSGKTSVDTLLGGIRSAIDVKTQVFRITLGEIALMNYSIVNKALRKQPVYKFNTLKSYFPNLKSTREFIIGTNYLSGIKIAIECREESLTPSICYEACINVLAKIATTISSIEETYEGTKEFINKPLRDFIKDKKVHYADPKSESTGISQNDVSIRREWKIDLSKENWFAYEDNYGTTEEKAFVSYFKTYFDRLRVKYDKVYLIRNERQLAIYSFSDGERFEPDYLLYLQKNLTDGYEQYQIFIEPKGTHLLANDKWKEDFLLQIESQGIAVKTFADDNTYKIWGFPFFNRDERLPEFSEAMKKL